MSLRLLQKLINFCLIRILNKICVLKILFLCYCFFMKFRTGIAASLNSIFAFDFLVLISLKLSLTKSAWILWMPLQMPSFLILFSQGLACFFPLIIPWLFILRVIDILFIWAAIAEFFQSVPGFVLPLHIWAPEFHKSSFALVLVWRVFY